MGAAIADMAELKVPVRISSTFYPNYPSEDESKAVYQPALMSQQISEVLITDLPTLYPDEHEDMGLYTDLSRPVFFGPRSRTSTLSNPTGQSVRARARPDLGRPSQSLKRWKRRRSTLDQMIEQPFCNGKVLGQRNTS